MHHLIFDGVTLYRVVLPELVALYDAFHERRALAARGARAAVRGLRAVGARLEQGARGDPPARAHWRTRLSDAPLLALPLDHPRPPRQRFLGAMTPLDLPAELVDRLRALGQRHGATLFQVLATAFSVLLQRYSGQDDIVFGTIADLRQRPELDQARRLLPDADGRARRPFRRPVVHRGARPGPRRARGRADPARCPSRPSCASCSRAATRRLARSTRPWSCSSRRRWSPIRAGTSARWRRGSATRSATPSSISTWSSTSGRRGHLRPAHLQHRPVRRRDVERLGRHFRLLREIVAEPDARSRAAAAGGGRAPELVEAGTGPGALPDRASSNHAIRRLARPTRSRWYSGARR